MKFYTKIHAYIHTSGLMLYDVLMVGYNKKQKKRRSRNSFAEAV